MKVIDCRQDNSIAGAEPGDYVVTATSIERLYLDPQRGLRMWTVVEDTRTVGPQHRKALEAAGVLSDWKEERAERVDYEQTVYAASIYGQ